MVAPFSVILDHLSSTVLVYHAPPRLYERPARTKTRLPPAAKPFRNCNFTGRC